MKKIYFAKVKENAIIPSKKEEDAGYDIYACFEEDYIEFEPNQTKLVPTGIAWASSPEFYLQIEERSSTGSKGIKKSAGVVDSGYRGEIKIAITNANSFKLYLSNLTEEEFRKKYKIEKESLVYCCKKAVAQAVVHRVEKLKVKEIDYEELKKIKSERRDKGWGSSNKWLKPIILIFFKIKFFKFADNFKNLIFFIYNILKFFKVYFKF